jgi:hypothetical protein
VSSLGVPWHPQILADQLTLSQPGGGDAHQIIVAPPDFQIFLQPCCATNLINKCIIANAFFWSSALKSHKSLMVYSCPKNVPRITQKGEDI